MADQDPCWPCEEDVIEKLPPCPLQCRSEKCKAFKRISLEGIPIVWVLGGPGSGKGTLCTKIISKYGFLLLLTDELVREEVKSGSVRGKCLSKILERNDTAPSDVIIDLLKDAIYRNARVAKGFVLDGFPKEKSQAVMFEKRIRPCTVIFYLEATSDTLTRRLVKRDASLNEQAVRQKVKATFELDELLLAAYSDKAFRINAENDADTMFRELSDLLDSFISNTGTVLPK
ncbi:adenylate kinase isoenzyme 1-like [Leguminivora glycinivorella]|uniref:adenylate kinase isoenzyme 1-like n=1 Tax=Leguminivora glycinivorella TaxID=1035111 RepID=UPI002010B8F6|nr:adenylate kinase isoenzyme 1-like [Leguminivora glycinivorella]